MKRIQSIQESDVNASAVFEYAFMVMASEGTSIFYKFPSSNIVTSSGIELKNLKPEILSYFLKGVLRTHGKYSGYSRTNQTWVLDYFVYSKNEETDEEIVTYKGEHILVTRKNGTVVQIFTSNVIRALEVFFDKFRKNMSLKELDSCIKYRN